MESISNLLDNSCHIVVFNKFHKMTNMIELIGIGFLVVNLILMVWIILWRKFFSAEGLGMAFLLLMVASDAFGLLMIYILNPSLADVKSELQLRFLPNIVLTIGLLSFFVGLLISDPNRRKSLHCDLSRKNKKIRQKIIATGYFLAFLGLSMKLFVLYSAGFRSIGDFFSGMYMYQAQITQGEFMHIGLNVAILGLSLLIAAYNNKRIKQIFFILAIIFISFVFSLSKSGIITALIILFFTIHVFNKEAFKRFFKPLPLIILFVIFLIGLGVKTQIKYEVLSEGSKISFNKETILNTSLSVIGRRFGPFGLYRGYSFMVNRLVEAPSLFFGKKIIESTITGWIPRFFWPDKPSPPFHARGDLTNEDRSIDIYANVAPTFAGFAFADAGYFSLIPYLLMGGFVLGLIRRTVTTKSKYSFPFVLVYIFFSTQMSGSLSETGFLNLFYYIALSAALLLAVFIFLGLRNLFKTSISSVLRNGWSTEIINVS